MAKSKKTSVKAGAKAPTVSSFKNGDELSKKTQISPVCVPTGFIPLDIAWAGGMKGGVIFEGFGEPSNGKSTFAYHVAAQYQKHGGFVAVIDQERSWDADWLSNLGVNIDKVLLYCAESLEDLYGLINRIFKKYKAEVPDNKTPFLIIVDTIDATPCANEMAEAGYAGGMMERSRINKGSMRLVSQNLPLGMTIIILNQVVTSLDPKDAITGGKASGGGYGPKHFSHIRTFFSTRGRERDDIGFHEEMTVTFNVIKNKLTSAMMPFSGTFNKSYGFNLISYLFDFLVKASYFTHSKGSPWYKMKFKGKEISVTRTGPNGLEAKIAREPDLLKFITEDVIRIFQKAFPQNAKFENLDVNKIISLHLPPAPPKAPKKETAPPLPPQSLEKEKEK